MTGRKGYNLSDLFDDQGNYLDGGINALGGGETGSG